MDKGRRLQLHIFQTVLPYPYHASKDTTRRPAGLRMSGYTATTPKIGRPIRRGMSRPEFSTEALRERRKQMKKQYQ